MKTKHKFKLTPQVHKAIVLVAKGLPVLVRQNADGSPQYRKLDTFKGTTGFNVYAKTYTKNTDINLVPVLVNHEVKMIETYQLYGQEALQKYVDMVNEISNASLEK